MQQRYFNMAIDEITISKIEQKLSLAGLNLLKPKEFLIPKLAQLVIQPDYVADLHLNLMLKHPDKYGVQKGLVEDLIGTFY